MSFATDDGLPKWHPRRAFSEDRPKLLLVEGQNEWHVLVRLLGDLNIEDVDVRCYEGITSLKEAVEAVSAGSHFGVLKTVAIWRDAEDDAGTAAAAASSALAGIHPTPPTIPLSWAEGEVRVGFMVLPGGDSPGCFEDICLAAVAGDPAIGCIDKFMACLAELAASDQLTLHHRTSKNRLEAYMASRADPNIPLGVAWEKGYLNSAHQAWKPIIEFIRGL